MVRKTAYREGKPGDRQDPEEPGHTQHHHSGSGEQTGSGPGFKADRPTPVARFLQHVGGPVYKCMHLWEPLQAQTTALSWKDEKSTH